MVDFVRQAAKDPDVLAIKQTLYRVSGNSPIIASLAEAAENGKQVTVLVELKARFDEENNIIWAKKLEKAGCHVIYGLVGLKTHSKITLVVRQEEDGIRRYVHLGTGNYNDSTAKMYTDMGLLTCAKPIVVRMRQPYLICCRVIRNRWPGTNCLWHRYGFATGLLS